MFMSLMFFNGRMLLFFSINLYDSENIYVTINKLTATIRNKVWTINIVLDEGQLLIHDLYRFKFENSEFCDPDHN